MQTYNTIQTAFKNGKGDVFFQKNNTNEFICINRNDETTFRILEKLGFIEGKDFSLTETSFVMLEQSKIVHSFIHHPAVEATYDLEGSELTPYISAYDEPEFIIHPEVPAVLDEEGNEIYIVAHEEFLMTYQKIFNT